MDDVLTMLMEALPALIATLAPAITAAVKMAVGDKLPASVKPLINAVAGAILAGIMGGDPTSGVVAAMIGNRVREAAKS